MSTPTAPDFDLDAPLAFARELFATLGAGGDPRLLPPAPDAFAAAIRRLAELLPDETGLGGVVAEVDELAHSWAGSAYDSGITFGAAAEHLRASIAGAVGTADLYSNPRAQNPPAFGAVGRDDRGR